MEDKRAALEGLLVILKNCTRENVADMRFEDLTEQKVIVTFENGHEMRVNVGGDSAAALIYDVTRALIW